jgi:hypothetical protein
VSLLYTNQIAAQEGRGRSLQPAAQQRQVGLPVHSFFPQSSK